MMHYETISPELRSIINRVFGRSEFNEFTLGGGTALALQLGHRLSVDADFISPVYFDKDKLLKATLDAFSKAKDIHQGTFGLFLQVDGIKLDFLSWNFSFIRPAVSIGNWRLLDPADIAAMKLFAILQRGEKKDYIDIAELLKIYTLSQILSFYKERHPGSDEALVLKFLLSYSDFESQPLPHMLNNMEWDGAKQIIKKSITEFMKGK